MNDRNTKKIMYYDNEQKRFVVEEIELEEAQANDARAIDVTNTNTNSQARA